MRSIALALLFGSVVQPHLSPADAASAPPQTPFLQSELIFPPEPWHVHGSCIVQLPNRDLLACWFHGSGERTADDVLVQGALLKHDSRQWSQRFTLADTPGYPDCNPAMVVTPDRRLWLFWPTILDNHWESALLKYRVASNLRHPTPPPWDREGVVHITPDDRFITNALRHLDTAASFLPNLNLPANQQQRIHSELDAIRSRATNKLSRRLGWMTRAHPVFLPPNRLLVPLYSDGFDFSLMAWTEDDGVHWHTSAPLLGFGNVQPSVVQRQDGSLLALMRDNGPAPQRVMASESLDRGATWSTVTDTPIPNPGSGAEVIRLANGHWLFIGNDTEDGRHQLAVLLSEDEGRTWPWKRRLEQDPPGPGAGRYHYPSIIQARDGTLHVTYSHHTSRGGTEVKSIKHAHFNEAWVRAGTTRNP